MTEAILPGRDVEVESAFLEWMGGDGRAALTRIKQRGGDAVEMQIAMAALEGWLARGEWNV